MLPLDTIAELLVKHGHPGFAMQMRSLHAREEMRIEGFWQDLGAPEIWGPTDSIASLRLPDPEDDQRLHRALHQVANEMQLCGVGSPESDAYADRTRANA